MTKHHDLLAIDATWDALLLVCKDCRRRKNGPNLKAKELAKDLKREVRRTLPRVRIVLTTCLGLCPKKSTSVGLVAGNGVSRIISVESKDQLVNIAPLLIRENAADANRCISIGA